MCASNSPHGKQDKTTAGIEVHLNIEICLCSTRTG
jgi:hypothetical protein